MGFFDYDFKFNNVMLNIYDPERLYFIDASLGDITEDPDYVDEIISGLVS